jgi:hypothetical protein
MNDKYDIKNLFKFGLIDIKTDTLEGLVDTKIAVAINFFIGFSAIVAVMLLVVSGYMFMTAAGDPEKIEKAQKGVTAAIIGMVIVFLAKILVEFVLKRIVNTGTT